MKTALFERIALDLMANNISNLHIKGHHSEASVALSLEEIDILICDLLNHRSMVIEQIKEQKKEKDLLREQRR